MGRAILAVDAWPCRAGALSFGRPQSAPCFCRRRSGSSRIIAEHLAGALFGGFLRGLDFHGWPNACFGAFYLWR